MAWHYTSVIAAVSILKTGVIRRAEDFIHIKEKPVVWFSTEPDWEPTTTSNLVTNAAGEMKPLGVEAAEKHGGCVRFGYPVDKLKSIQDFKKNSGCPPRIFKSVSSTPWVTSVYNWRVSYEEIPAEECVVEFRYSGRWRPLKELGGIVGSELPDDILAFYREKVGLTHTTEQISRRYLRTTDVGIMDTRTGDVYHYKDPRLALLPTQATDDEHMAHILRTEQDTRVVQEALSKFLVVMTPDKEILQGVETMKALAEAGDPLPGYPLNIQIVPSA